MSSEKSDAGQDLLEVNATAKSDVANHDRENESNTTTSGQTQCSICQSTFRRPEHLKRHFRSHTKEKPFECAQCGRHFSRTDTLHRHELSHHTAGTDGGKDRTHRITVKTFRACFKCAVARVRCSGGSPCSRCENRSLECQYPTERRSKAKIPKAGGHSLSPDKEDVSLAQNSHSFAAIPSQVPEDAHGNPAENPTAQPHGYQVTQFQVQMPGVDASTSSTSVSSELNSQEQVSKHLDNNGGAAVARKTKNSLLQSHASRILGANQRPSPSFSGNNRSYYSHLPNSRLQGTLATEQGPSLHRQPGASPSEIEGSSMNNMSEVTDAEKQHIQLAFSQPFIDQSSLTTINWLSNDLFLDSANYQDLASRPSSHPFQPAVFDNSLNQTSWLPPVISAEPVNPPLPGNMSQTPSGTISLGGSLEASNRTLRNLSQSHSDTAKRPANHHVDESSTRPQKLARKQLSWPTELPDSADCIPQSKITNTTSRFSFPSPQDMKVHSAPETPMEFQITSSIYDQIHNSFIKLCCTDNFLYQKFESDVFLGAEDLSSLFNLYFYFFQPIYPILHTPTFDSRNCHWLLVLSLAAVGSHAARHYEINGTVSALNEFVRRALNVEREKYQSGQMPLWLLQAILLNCICMLHGSDERRKLLSQSDFSNLVNLATQEELLSRSEKPTFPSHEPFLERQWHRWIEDETRRRTGYLIWLVDCTIAYHFDSKPLFSLEDGQAPLPCHEKLWQAGSAELWKGLYDEVSDEVSLYDAVLIIYIEKRLVPETGVFSQILLIHALYHRMWEVGDYFRRPLSFWNPTAKKQSRSLAIPSGSVWLPGIPSYSKWRNSACDCLDILHWTVDSTVENATVQEHPTLLHLHTARIIILAPFREVRSFAASLIMEKVAWSNRQQVIEWHYILRWIRHDQYKARLAVVHAGSALRHIRRYPTGAFHEPIAAFLAILTLWAYGVCHTQARPELAPHVGIRRDSPGETTAIHLDQPCDDELVQLFVREGQAMKGILTGVGDICAPHGPERVLQVGCDTLVNLASWGVSKGFISLLTKLAELTSQ